MRWPRRGCIPAGAARYGVQAIRLAASRLPVARIAGKPVDWRAMTTLEDLRKLADRVKEASQALDELRDRRDKAIREVRRSTDHTVPEIAEAAGVSPATVKTVIRGLR